MAAEGTDDEIFEELQNLNSLKEVVMDVLKIPSGRGEIDVESVQVLVDDLKQELDSLHGFWEGDDSRCIDDVLTSLVRRCCQVVEITKGNGGSVPSDSE